MYALKEKRESEKWSLDTLGNAHIHLKGNKFTKERWLNYYKTSLLSREARMVIEHAPTEPIQVDFHKVVIFRGDHIPQKESTIFRANEIAFSKGYKRPSWEVACLLRRYLKNTDLTKLNLQWLMVMHEPVLIKGYPYFLFLSIIRGHRLQAESQPADQSIINRGGFVYIED